MSIITRTSPARRSTKALAAVGAGIAVLAAVGGGVAAASPDAPAASGKGPAVSGGTTQNLGAYSRNVGATVTVPAGGFLSSTVSCPAGQVALGGGESNSAFGTMVLTDSWPSSTTTWLVWVKNNGTASGTYNAYVLCGA
jgi:hypothetical protein